MPLARLKPYHLLLKWSYRSARQRGGQVKSPIPAEPGIGKLIERAIRVLMAATMILLRRGACFMASGS